MSATVSKAPTVSSRDRFFVVAQCAEGSHVVNSGSAGAYWEQRWVRTTLASFQTYDEAFTYAASIAAGRSKYTRNIHVEERP